MYVPNCDDCDLRTECALFLANKEMRETIWNINREKSGRLDFIFNGKYFPAEEPKIQFVSVKPAKLEVDGNLGEIVKQPLREKESGL